MKNYWFLSFMILMAVMITTVTANASTNQANQMFKGDEASIATLTANDQELPGVEGTSVDASIVLMKTPTIIDVTADSYNIGTTIDGCNIGEFTIFKEVSGNFEKTAEIVGFTSINHFTGNSEDLTAGHENIMNSQSSKTMEAYAQVAIKMDESADTTYFSTATMVREENQNAAFDVNTSITSLMQEAKTLGGMDTIDNSCNTWLPGTMIDITC